jgi:hypothetical protein
LQMLTSNAIYLKSEKGKIAHMFTLIALTFQVNQWRSWWCLMILWKLTWGMPLQPTSQFHPTPLQDLHPLHRAMLPPPPQTPRCPRREVCCSLFLFFSSCIFFSTFSLCCNLSIILVFQTAVVSTKLLKGQSSCMLSASTLT